MVIWKRSSYVLFAVTQESTKHLYYRSFFSLYYCLVTHCYKRTCQREEIEEGARINRRVHLFWGLKMSTVVRHPLVPAEWNMPRAVTSFLHQGLVEFPASTRMDSSPAIFTVILQTGNISTEKWGKFPPTTGSLTFITQLIIQDIWLNFHL